MIKEQSIKELCIIPGVGKSLATDLWNIGITSIVDLKGKDPDNSAVTSQAALLWRLLERSLAVMSW